MYVCINQSILVYLMTRHHNWHKRNCDYIADLECSKAKYPECPTDSDIYRA